MTHVTLKNQANQALRNCGVLCVKVLFIHSQACSSYVYCIPLVPWLSGLYLLLASFQDSSCLVGSNWGKTYTKYGRETYLMPIDLLLRLKTRMVAPEFLRPRIIEAWVFSSLFIFSRFVQFPQIWRISHLPFLVLGRLTPRSCTVRIASSAHGPLLSAKPRIVWAHVDAFVRFTSGSVEYLLIFVWARNWAQ